MIISSAVSYERTPSYIGNFQIGMGIDYIIDGSLSVVRASKPDYSSRMTNIFTGRQVCEAAGFKFGNGYTEEHIDDCAEVISADGSRYLPEIAKELTRVLNLRNEQHGVLSAK